MIPVYLLSFFPSFLLVIITPHTPRLIAGIWEHGGITTLYLEVNPRVIYVILVIILPQKQYVCTATVGQRREKRFLFSSSVWPVCLHSVNEHQCSETGDSILIIKANV